MRLPSVHSQSIYLSRVTQLQIAARVGAEMQVPGMVKPHHSDVSSSVTRSQSKPRDRSLTKPLGRSPKPVSKLPGKLGRSRPWWTALLVLGAIGLIGGSGWLAVQLIVSPQTLLWINRFFPGWVPVPINGLKPPQTLAEIGNEVQQAGQRLGEPIVLGSNVSSTDGKSAVTDTLIPIFAQQPNCQSAVCEKIVELRLYQTATAATTKAAYLQLATQISIVAPEEALVLAPLVAARSASPGSNRALPLTQLSRFEGKVPTQGVWLNLSGRLDRGDNSIRYGQVIHYNPARFHLGVLLNWTSPPGKDPAWQEVTGGGTAELVVDQTIGLEPQFQIYQVKPSALADSPVQLEAISLETAAIDHSTYSTALLLAQSGLWFPAWDVLRSFKPTTNQWSPLAQAQLDLIHWHSQATHAQADKIWASPGQQVLANLIDGRWKPGLLAFESSAESSRETVALLKADKGRLQQRVEAALKVNPRQWEPRAWKVLLLAVQQNRAAAIAWLKQRQATAVEITRANRLIDRLDPAFTEAEPAASAGGQFLGTARAIAQVYPAEWRFPSGNPPKPEEAAGWYIVQVSGFSQGKSWKLGELDLPAAPSADALWKLLGLATANPTLQILFWQPDGQQQSVSTTLKAARLNAGTLELLAAGDAAPPLPKSRPRPLAFTESVLQWLNPDRISLTDWVHQQPDWAKKAIPALAAELKRSGELPPNTDLTWAALESLGVGNWQVQAAPLTGTNPLDVVVTLNSKSLLDPNRPPKPRTLILAATGSVIYSELSTEAGQIYVAIADLGDQSRPVLVVDTPNNYTFLRWSAQHQRFQ